MIQQLGAFRILEEIGRGGMGTVYRGVDPIIGRPVAIKVIRLIGYNDSEEQTWLRDRLFREARAAGSLSHPGIVTIYQVGEEQELAYIAMEFVSGPTLQQALSVEPTLETAQLCRILREAAAALDYAHERGVIHRDVKPANIMVSNHGGVKITDFGIAKTLLGRTTTNTGMILGTPFYMSPEQVIGQALDGRSDQFALAVVAYEMFTGQKPFYSERVTGICYQIVHEEPLALQGLGPPLGFSITETFRRGLAKNPADRFNSCTEFATTLIQACREGSFPHPASCAERLPYTIELDSNPGNIPSEPSRDPATNGARPLEKPRFLPKSVIILGVCIILTAAIGTLTYLFRQFFVAVPARGPTIASKKGTSENSRPAIRAISPVPLKEPLAVPRSDKSVAIPPLQKPPLKPAPSQENSRNLPYVLSPPTNGTCLWVGPARNNRLLTIEGNRASTGTLIGNVPGGVVSIRAYPAEIRAEGVIVFTTDTKYATPVHEVLNGQRLTYIWEPRRATDITLWEVPEAKNRWTRLVLRLNNPQLSACVIAWSIQRVP